MVISAFTFAKTPKILFGAGQFNKLADLVSAYGKNVLLITGAASFRNSDRWGRLVDSLYGKSIFDFVIKSEPSPETIDIAVEKFKDKDISVVVAIGGGSVVDAGKAVSAMLPQKGLVLEYLEGVGTRNHDGRKIPFIAVPTTSGTGSEATKNAVLSRIGPDGFKKSLRHDNLVPDIAVVDPELTLSCPSDLTAACGMDAFSQLFESYVSTNASPMTDALALSGLQLTKDNLIAFCQDGGGKDIVVRTAMSYASLISGITLANAGLGIVHGLASPIGGYFDIPHGVVCGTLVAAAAQINIEALRRVDDNVSLEKFALVGAMLTGCDSIWIDKCCTLLIETLDSWVQTLNIPRLGKYGITESFLDKIVDAASNKQNPVKLSKNEIKQILLMRL